MVRLSDLEGASDAARERVEDASGGSCWSADGMAAASAASFNRFRRLWGASSATCGCDSAGVCVAEKAAVDCALLLLLMSGAYDLDQKLPPPTLPNSCLFLRAFDQKYVCSSDLLFLPAAIWFAVEVAENDRAAVGFCSSLLAQRVHTSSRRMACALGA